VKQNRFTFPLFRKKYLVNDVTSRVGNTRLDLNLKRLVFAASDLHPNPDEHGTALLCTQFSGQLRGRVSGERDAGEGKAKTDTDETSRSNAKMKIHKYFYKNVCWFVQPCKARLGVNRELRQAG